MSLRAEIAPQLPFLRRYARALTGSQTLGDNAVREVLEGLQSMPFTFDADAPPRLELYRAFHLLWRAIPGDNGKNGMLSSMSLNAREALLLTTVEGFTDAQAALILETTVANVTSEIEQTRAIISASLKSKVMIIEDEVIIALDIKSIVESQGHGVTGIARTRDEAFALAECTSPGLILADVSLADGSSGIGAMEDIAGIADVPVIFITAFPEMLLTGECPEPPFLITKPFSPSTVAATIDQALLFHRESAHAP